MAAKNNSNDPKLRALILIAPPKLADKALSLLSEREVFIRYRFNALGTATSEVIDLLGLGSIDKKIMISILPKSNGDEILNLLHLILKFDSTNSGIAFTVPINACSKLVLKLVEKQINHSGKKEAPDMNQTDFSMITAIVNQGFSDNVMSAAKAAGARGGTVIQSRKLNDADSSNIWEKDIKEERDIVLIVVPSEKKNEVMKSISEKCGANTDAEGLILSLPIDNIIGLSKKKTEEES